MSARNEEDSGKVVTFIEVDPDKPDPAAIDAFLETLGFPKKEYERQGKDQETDA